MGLGQINFALVIFVGTNIRILVFEEPDLADKFVFKLGRCDEDRC